MLPDTIEVFLKRRRDALFCGPVPSRPRGPGEGLKFTQAFLSLSGVQRIMTTMTFEGETVDKFENSPFFHPNLRKDGKSGFSSAQGPDSN